MKFPNYLCNLLIALFLSIIGFNQNLIAQMANNTIQGESLFRNQGYGVTNHTFDIVTYNTNNGLNYTTTPDPTTAACPNEVYTSTTCQLSTSLNSPWNTLKIYPHSVNDATDYRNGVSTLDLVAMQSQINGPPNTLFTARTPTEDWPYRFISSDADNNNQLQQADVTMVQSLILGTRNDLTRKSWAWVHKDEVEINQTDFETYPDMYDYVIEYNWGAPDGIILPGNTTNQINADEDKYFTFRTTKTGDIIGTSGGGNNSWVCGTGAYVTSPHISSRNSNDLPAKTIMKGSTVRLSISMFPNEDVLSSEFAIRINPEDFEIAGVLFNGSFNPKWHFNTTTGILTTSDFNQDLTPLQIAPGQIMQITLIAKQVVSKLNNAVGWYSERAIEVSNMNEEIINPHIELRLEEIIPAEFFSQVRIDDNDPFLYIESPKTGSAVLRYFDYQGRSVQVSDIHIQKGENVLAIEKLIPGLYFIQTEFEGQISITKLMVN